MVVETSRTTMNGWLPAEVFGEATTCHSQDLPAFVFDGLYYHPDQMHGGIRIYFSPGLAPINHAQCE